MSLRGGSPLVLSASPAYEGDGDCDFSYLTSEHPVS